MFCTKCGNEIKAGENFCSKCGARVNSNDNSNQRANKSKVVIIIAIILVVIIALIIIFIVNNNKTKEQVEDIQVIAETKLETRQWSDTDIRKIIQEYWDNSYKHMNEASISKIEKIEEDGKGRYIYEVDWSYYDQNIGLTGWSPYLLYDASPTGIVKEAIIYGIDTNNTPENPNIIGIRTSEKEAYTAIEKMKEKEELYWNIDINSEQYKRKQQQVSSKEDDKIIADIQQRIDFFNNYEQWEFQPTDEQMNEMIQLYKDNSSNFTNDLLKDFILLKGWLSVRGTAYIDSDVNQKESISASKEEKINTTSESKIETTTNSNIKETVVAKILIDLDSLIAKNEKAKEIKEKYPTIFIYIDIEDASVWSGLLQFFDGGESIPSEIRTRATILEGYNPDTDGNYKDRNEKRKIKITMDNTSTAKVETTLFEGEMAFPNSEQIYEIK